MNGFRDFISLTESNSLVENLNTEHEILHLYHNPTHRIVDISDQTGVSPGGIYRILQKYQINPYRRNEQKHYEQVFAYKDMGMSAKRIAEITGYSTRQVYNIMSLPRPAFQF